MARLTDKRVQHRTNGGQRVVSFITDEHGDVDISEVEGDCQATLGFEDASADEVREVLDDVLEDDWGREHISEAAEETARDILDKLEAQMEADGEEESTEADDEEEADEDDDTGEVVHVTEDGTEVRIGDTINSPDGGVYRITGREGEHVLRKFDITDDWGVVVSKVENDIKECGFSERVEVDC